jgi:hypothetical protein
MSGKVVHMIWQRRLSWGVIALLTIFSNSTVFTQARNLTIIQQRLKLPCADFHRNPDGSWSPVRPLAICHGFTADSSMVIYENVVWCGFDLAAALNRQCR